MATAKQIAARKLFAERARSGAFKRAAKRKPRKKNPVALVTGRVETDYSGKYPNRIRSVAALTRGIARVTLNSGTQYTIHAIDYAGKLPKVGVNLFDWMDANNAPAKNPIAKPRKKNPLVPGTVKSTPRRKSYAFSYMVQFKFESGGEWHPVAGFSQEDDAMQYARAYARLWKNRAVRVVDNFAA